MGTHGYVHMCQKSLIERKHSFSGKLIQASSNNNLLRDILVRFKWVLIYTVGCQNRCKKTRKCSFHWMILGRMLALPSSDFDIKVACLNASAIRQNHQNDHGIVEEYDTVITDTVTIATITVYVGSFMPTRTSTAWRPQGSETAIDCRSLVLLVLLSCQTALVIRLRLVGFWWGLFMLWLMLGRCLSDIHSTATDLKSKCQCKVMHHPGHPVHYISVILR